MESAAESGVRDEDPAKATAAGETGKDLGPVAMVRDPGRDWVSAVRDRQISSSDDRSTESPVSSGAWIISPSTCVAVTAHQPLSHPLSISDRTDLYNAGDT